VKKAKDPEELLPSQKEGSETNSRHSKEYGSEKEAREVFALAVERLLHMNRWYLLTGKGTASFQLTDEQGNNIEGPARVGQRLRIDIPAPGTEAGHGFDWVRIESVIDKRGESPTHESFVVRVRPVDNPESGSSEVSHFFQGTATSSFAVVREKSVVMTSVHGRNEKPNTGSSGWFDKFRNAIIGFFAGKGMSFPQWKRLAIALQKPRNEADQKR
jgi:hypothetical protein